MEVSTTTATTEPTLSILYDGNEEELSVEDGSKASTNGLRAIIKRVVLPNGDECDIELNDSLFFVPSAERRTEWYLGKRKVSWTNKEKKYERMREDSNRFLNRSSCPPVYVIT